jgi:hypothetical protein
MSSLFHSLVVCGAGITLLQCGGRAQVSGDEPTSGGAGGSTGGRGSSAQGGRASVGGMFSLGGALSTGGTFGVAGSPGAGGASGAFGGTSAWQQWDCSTDNIHGCATGPDSGLAFELGQSCGVNPARPRSANDCGAGQVFSCLTGELNGETGLFNCACLPRTADVPCPCPSSGLGCNASYSSKCSDVQVHCSCAYTCILK